jgi:hypothetical protein
MLEDVGASLAVEVPIREDVRPSVSHTTGVVTNGKAARTADVAPTGSSVHAARGGAEVLPSTTTFSPLPPPHSSPTTTTTEADLSDVDTSSRIYGGEEAPKVVLDKIKLYLEDIILGDSEELFLDVDGDGEVCIDERGGHAASEVDGGGGGRSRTSSFGTGTEGDTEVERSRGASSIGWDDVDKDSAAGGGTKKKRRRKKKTRGKSDKPGIEVVPPVSISPVGGGTLVVAGGTTTNTQEDKEKREKLDAWLSKGAHLSRHQALHTTLLLDAAEVGHVEATRVLLDKPGVRVLKEKNVGETALHLAVRQAHGAVVDLLLARPEIQVNRGDISPLYIAAANGHLDIVNKLLAHPQIDVSQARCDGASPLLIASENGHVDVVTSLLKAGLPKNKVGEG